MKCLLADLRLNEALTEVVGHKVLHAVGHLVRAQTAQHQQLLEVIQAVLPSTRQLLPEDNAKQCNTMQYNARQCEAMQGKAMRGNARQCEAMRGNARQCKAMQGNEIQFNAMKYNLMQYNEIRCNTMQHNTM